MDLREVVNGILYVLRAGCPWRMTPPICRLGRHCTSTSAGGLMMGPGNGSMRRFGPWPGRPKGGMPLPPELVEGAAIIDSQSVKTTEKGASGL